MICFRIGATLIKYIMSNHHWGNKTKKPKYFLKPMCIIITIKINYWPSRLGLQNTPIAFLQRGKPLTTSVLDMTLKSGGEAPVMLEIWGMWGTSLLPSLLGPLWLGVVAPDRVLSMGQIELNCILMLN